MTAKEKAKELFDRFYEIEPVEPIYVGVNIGQAKQCVLICVNEMIKELTEQISPSVHGFRHNYWKEVKQEVNKL
tara:strand:- start:331 stop:552 length:222 start_codon:yes stop_codon:yes gene_type:complete